MALPGFIFGGNTNLSYDELQRRRQISDALAARLAGRQPKNTAEGIGALIQGAAVGIGRSSDNRAEAAGRKEATDIFNRLIGGGSSTVPDNQTQGFVNPSANAMPMPGAAAEARRTDPVGEVLAAASPSQGTSWLSYSNQNATRSQPISGDLQKALGFLPDMGVTMQVFSGGQDAEGPNRTGSHRHDHGNAADVFFYKDGRKLDWANEADRPVFEEIVKRGRAAGVTGFGAGDGYMQPGSMHLGFGSPAVWGAGGSGSTAPDWLKNAFNSPYRAGAGNQMAAASPQAAIDAVSPPSGLPMNEMATANPAPALPAPREVSSPVVSPQQQMPQQQQPVQVAGGGGRPSNIEILKALQNPWLSGEQKAVLQAVYEQQQQEQDPLRQLQIQKMRQDLSQPEYDIISGKDGSIFRADKRAGTVEQVYGGKNENYRVLSNDEEQKFGLDPAQSYQIGPDNKISKIGGEGTTVNIDQRAEGAFDKKLAEGQAEAFNTMAADGINARADIGVINELDGLLKGQGGTLTGLSGVLSKYGIGGENVDDLQAAQALINKLIPSQRAPGSGSMSDRDVEMFSRSLPSLWNTPGGNEKILNVMRGLAQYKQQQGEIADQVINNEMSRQEGRRALRALPNPLSDFKPPEGKKAAAENPLPPQPQSQSGPQAGAVEDGYRFKGGDPADPNNWERAQ